MAADEDPPAAPDPEGWGAISRRGLLWTVSTLADAAKAAAALAAEMAVEAGLPAGNIPVEAMWAAISLRYDSLKEKQEITIKIRAWKIDESHSFR